MADTAIGKLLNALKENKLPNGEKTWDQYFYKWCATYCVFRGDRQPKKSTDLPMVKLSGMLYLVRQIYTDVAKTAVFNVVSNMGANVSLDYNKVGSKLTIPSLTEMAKFFGATISTNPQIAPINNELPMMVGIKDAIPGAGGILHAPTPSARLIGTIQNYDAKSPTADIMVYVRGEHFVKSPYVEKVHAMGLDPFRSVLNAAPLVSAVLTQAYRNLRELADITDAEVTIDPTTGTIKVGAAARGTLAEFHRDIVKPAFGGNAYGNALDIEAMHTYVSDFANLGPQLDTVETSLKDSTVAGAKILYDAVVNMKKKFVTPPDMPSGTPPKPSTKKAPKATPKAPPPKPSSKQPEIPPPVVLFEETERLRTQNTELKATNKRIQQELETIKSLRADEQLQDIRRVQELNRIQDELAAGKSKVARYDEMERDLATTQNELAAAKSEVERHSEALRYVSDNLAESNRQNKELIEEIEELRDRIAKLESSPGKVPTRPTPGSSASGDHEKPEVYELRSQISQIVDQIFLLRDRMYRERENAALKEELTALEKLRDNKSREMFGLAD